MIHRTDSSPAMQSFKGDEVPEVMLVQALRKHRGEAQRMQVLCEQLLYRCEPMFQRHVRGLLHRPDLREDALANMREHLLREAMDPKEIFITQNFPHYLLCVAREEFTRTLRQEGMLPYRDDRPRKGNLPERIPASLIVRLPAGDDEFDGERGPAEMLGFQQLYENPHEALLAEIEVRRLICHLDDPLDRDILILRAIQAYKWDDIASFCRCSERTARLRYDHICAFLCTVLRGEREAERQGQNAVSNLRTHPPTLARKSVREHCLQNQEERTRRKRRAVIEAIDTLRQDGQQVTKDAVIHRANVSATFLRAHIDLLQKIEEGALV